MKVNRLPPMISSNPAECGTRVAISEVRSSRDDLEMCRSIYRILSAFGRSWTGNPIDPGLRRRFRAASNPLRRGVTLALGLVGSEMRAALGETGTF